MIFRELSNPEYSAWLFPIADGLVAYRDITPSSVMEKFEKINKEHRAILGKNFIDIRDHRPNGELVFENGVAKFK